MENKKNNKTQTKKSTEQKQQSLQNAGRKNVDRKTRYVYGIKSKLQLKTKNQAQKAKTPQNKTLNRLKIMFTIVGRSKAEYYLDLIQSFDVNMQIAILANGMAPKSIMELLGLSSSEKVVIVSVIQEAKIPDALASIEEKFSTIKDGKGIAFTVPMTSVIGTLIYGFLSNNKMAVKEEKTK